MTNPYDRGYSDGYFHRDFIPLLLDGIEYNEYYRGYEDGREDEQTDYKNACIYYEQNPLE